MANVTWKLTTGGDWDTAADWSSGAIPGTADAVSIVTTAAATVTHAKAVADAIANLSTAPADTLSISAGSLTVYGAAVLAGGAAIAAGSLTLDGTSTMGSLAETGGALNIGPGADTHYIRPDHRLGGHDLRWNAGDVGHNDPRRQRHAVRADMAGYRRLGRRGRHAFECDF